MDIQQKIGNRIRDLRNQKGLSQEKLSLLAEVDRTYMTGIETGKRNVSVSVLERIISALGSSFSEFFNSSSFTDGR